MKRFTKLYELPKHLYAPSSPVIVEAGLLLKDNETSTIVAQLKFHNISGKAVTGLKIVLACYDALKNNLEDVHYQYSGFTADNNNSFGSDKAIVITASDVASFKIASLEVYYADGTTVLFDGSLTELPRSESLSSVSSDPEVIKQYKLETTSQALYVPQDEGKLWCCTCGEWNSSDICRKCGCSKNKVFSALNVSSLEAAVSERIAKDNQIKKEKAQKSQAAIKKTTNIAKIIVPVVAVIAFAFLWLIPNISKNSAYKEAISLLDNHQYTEAYYKLQKCKGHKDTDEILKDFVVVYEQSVYTSSLGDLTETIQHYYDENGVLVRDVETLSNGLIYHVTYSNGEHGCIREDHTSPNRADYSLVVEHTYDDSGKLIKSKSSDSDGYTVKEYKYTNFGELKEKTVDYSGFIPDDEYKYFYDSDNKCIKEERWTDGDITPFQTTELTYDKAGNCTKRTTVGRDGEIDSIIDYYYDEYGNMYKYVITYSSGRPASNVHSGLLIFYSPK